MSLYPREIPLSDIERSFDLPLTEIQRDTLLIEIAEVLVYLLRHEFSERRLKTAAHQAQTVLTPLVRIIACAMLWPVLNHLDQREQAIPMTVAASVKTTTPKVHF